MYLEALLKRSNQDVPLVLYRILYEFHWEVTQTFFSFTMSCELYKDSTLDSALVAYTLLKNMGYQKNKINLM